MVTRCFESARVGRRHYVCNAKQYITMRHNCTFLCTVLKAKGFVICLQKKCEQYWPENIDETLTPGLNLSVTLTSILPYAEYEVRKFTVKDVSDLYSAVRDDDVTSCNIPLGFRSS